MRLLLSGLAAPASVAVYQLDPDPSKWRIYNPTTGLFDPYAPPRPDPAHLMPLLAGPAGVTQQTLWLDLPDAAAVRGCLVQAYVVDGNGVVVASPGSEVASAIVDPGQRSLRLTLAP